MEALVAAIGKTENIALIVLMLMCAGLGWAHVIWRKEEREDRRAMVETFSKIAEALNDLRVAVAVLTGKQS